MQASACVHASLLLESKTPWLMTLTAVQQFGEISHSHTPHTSYFLLIAHIERGLVSPQSYILLKHTLQSSRGEFFDCIDLFAQETALFILRCDYAFTCAWSLICFNWIPISGFIFHCVLTIAEPSSSGMRLEGYAGIHSTLQLASTRNNLLDLVSTARTP